MRTWGRNAQGQWVKVETDENGYNDQVYLTTLCQTLKLNLGESPFFANLGLPAQQSIMSQVAPDLHVAIIQQDFSPMFKSLTIQRVPGSVSPSYRVNVITHAGAVMSAEVVL